MLIRRRIDAAYNFTNKPVSFACNGVQIRRRISHKAGTKESGRTAQNSRNASRAWKKILQKTAQRAAACLMIDGKQRRGGAAPRTHNLGEARGKGYRERGEAAHRGGEYRGGDRSRGRRTEGTPSEKVRRGVVVWVQLLARAYIYSCYI